ncbi:cytochrome-c peroxidase [Ekhidna sp.]
MKLTTYLFLVTLTLLSCESESPEFIEVKPVLPEIPYDYANDNNQATLGRVLFYDKQLSINNGVSCASCHKQANAFSDNLQFSRGFDNRPTERNSMPIQNLVEFSDFNNPDSNNGLFWDGRGLDHDKSLLLPIINHVEMGIPNIEYLVTKIGSIEYYPALFENAFFDGSINAENISSALFAFTHSIKSNNTKLDNSLRGIETLTPKEAFGQELFISKYDCNSCHQVQSPHGYLFGGAFSNIGLEMPYQDSGLENVTENSLDNGKFKIPSLRNVALTAPYMHDGRFSTLEEVVNHYKSGVTEHPNLDIRLKNNDGSLKRPEITETEMGAIIAFLGTLTDYDLIEDERFSNPFE